MAISPGSRPKWSDFPPNCHSKPKIMREAPAMMRTFAMGFI